MKHFKTILAAAIFLVPAFHINASADEGMWMVNCMDKILERNLSQAGLNLPAGCIYDEEKGGICDAVVSLNFSCSGSMISEDGLMITNHHCAYADIFALSSTDNNYLENGFWAMKREDELPVRGQEFFFLRKVLDVTEEVDSLKRSGAAAGKVMMFRRLSNIIEKKYQTYFPNQQLSLYSMYYGEKYYLMVYDSYTDVRLVAAPPVCIGSYGAEVDNWEWPQHKGDFAIYRIYTAPDGSPASYSPENVPLHPRRTLKVSTKGVKDGDFTMVLGYPGVTNRYASSFEVDKLANNTYPVVSALMKERIDIMDKAMNADPQVRLKYSDYYFMQTNVQEIREGEIMCYRKGATADVIASRIEKNLPAGLLDSLKTAFELNAPIEKQICYYQQSTVRSGHLTRLGYTCRNMKTAKDTLRVHKLIDSIDLPLEKEIFTLSVKEIHDYLAPRFWSPYIKACFDSLKDPAAVAENIWSKSALSSENPYSADKDDPVFLFINSMNIKSFHEAQDKESKDYDLKALKARYRHLVYQYCIDNNIPIYPDANSSLRLSYGNMTDLKLDGGEVRPSFSEAGGIVAKYDPDRYIFSLKKDLLKLYKKKQWGKWAYKDGKMHVNFITTNDITGGNSGSPVLNADGELIGLAFDGNKESLAGDCLYDDKVNRCVCVDIRYVLWILDKYAHMDGLLDEILN